MQQKILQRLFVMLSGRRLFVTALATLFIISVALMLRLDRLFTKPSFLRPLALHDPFLDLEGELRKKNIAIANSPVASDSAVLVQLAGDNTYVLFSQNKDVSAQVSSLQIILNKLTIEGRKAQKIDLRFGDPVVVY